MVATFLRGLGLERRYFRLPAWPVRWLSRVIGGVPGIPLTPSRVDGLTLRCRYDSSKIEEDLGFKFEKTLEDRFFQFASNLKKRP